MSFKYALQRILFCPTPFLLQIPSNARSPQTLGYIHKQLSFPQCPSVFLSVPQFSSVSLSFPGFAEAAPYKMLTTQTASVDTDPPKSRRLFRLYDPEVVAVMAILLGLVQVLLAVPTYNISVNRKYLFICPLSVGCVCVLAGSLSMASERSPSRQLLKNSMFAGLASLVVATIALFLYGYAVIAVQELPSCPESTPEPESESKFHNDTIKFCPAEHFLPLYNIISGVIIFYDVVALPVHCFLSYSAFKGLKTQ